MAHFRIVRRSAINGHGGSAGDARNPLQIMELGSGGQGRNRTIDTRIFSSSESRVRREKGEEVERVFDAPTEPPAPTEPMPNPALPGRPNTGARPMRVNELDASRPNFFRTSSRTGPRWVPAHSPSTPRDPPPKFTTLPSGRCPVNNDPKWTLLGWSAPAPAASRFRLVPAPSGAGVNLPVLQRDARCPPGKLDLTQTQEMMQRWTDARA